MSDVVAPHYTSLHHVSNAADLKRLGIGLNDEVWFTLRSDSLVYRGWVAQHTFDLPYSNPVVNRDAPGEYHGNFVGRIALIKASEPVKPQSKKKDKLVRDALAAATELGYCNETRNVIQKMGLQIPKSETTVTVTLKVTGDGVDVKDLSVEDLGLSVNSSKQFVKVAVEKA